MNTGPIQILNCDISHNVGSELVLSDLAVSSSSPTPISHRSTSPGLLLSLSLGLSQTDQTTSISIQGLSQEEPVNKDETHLIHPLLYLPEIPTHQMRNNPLTVQSIPNTLSVTYPGVDTFLRNFPDHKTSNTGEVKAPPLLTLDSTINKQDNKTLNSYHSIFIPPPNPSPQMPFLYIPPPQPHSHGSIPIPSYVNDTHKLVSHPPQINDWEEFTLPNVPIKPFVPQLVRPPPFKSLPLLTLNDPLSHMKREGFHLLHLPHDTKIPSLPISTTCNTSMTLSKAAAVSKKRRERARKQVAFQSCRQASSPQTSALVTPPTNQTIQITSEVATPTNLDITLVPHKTVTSHTSDNISDNDLSMPHPPSPTIQQQSSIEGTESKLSHIIANDSHQSPSPQSPSPRSPSPSTTSIAVQVDLSSSKLHCHEIKSAEVQTDLPDTFQSPDEPFNLVDPLQKTCEVENIVESKKSNVLHYITVSDVEEVEDDNDSKEDLTEEEKIVFPLRRTESKSTSPVLLQSSRQDVLKRFLSIEEQLLSLEQTAENMKDQFTNSRKILCTIDKLNKKDREGEVQSGPSLLLESSLALNNPSKDLHFLFESLTTTENPITSKEPSTEMLTSTGIPTLPVRRAIHKPVSTNNAIIQRDQPSNKRLPDTEPQSEIGGQSITERKKAKLRQWMVAKYKERHALYKAQREHLRSKERAPYQSQHKTKTVAKLTQAEKSYQEKENFKSRLQEAHKLMNDLLLSSKPPTLDHKGSTISLINDKVKNSKIEQQQRLSSSNYHKDTTTYERWRYKRRISSIEGLNEREQEKMADILALTEYDRDSVCSSSTFLSSVDWDQIDELLDNQ